MNQNNQHDWNRELCYSACSTSLLFNCKWYKPCTFNVVWYIFLSGTFLTALFPHILHITLPLHFCISSNSYFVNIIIYILFLWLHMHTHIYILYKDTCYSRHNLILIFYMYQHDIYYLWNMCVKQVMWSTKLQIDSGLCT